MALLEVLGALLLLNTALLGLLSTQLRSLQASRDAYLHTLATLREQDRHEHHWASRCYYRTYDEDTLDELLAGEGRSIRLHAPEPLAFTGC